MTPATAALRVPNGATVTVRVRVATTARGRKRLEPDRRVPGHPAAPVGRVPRVARMMALAIHWQGLIRAGVTRDQAGLARLVGVSRARVTQVMDLLRLAPEIQESVLDLPRVEKGRDAIRHRDLQRIAADALWTNQRRAWNEYRNLKEIHRAIRT